MKKVKTSPTMNSRSLLCWGQLFQDLQRLLFAPVAVFTARPHTGGTAVRAGTVADQLEGAGDQLIVHLKKSLTEPDPGRYGVVQDQGRLAKVFVLDRLHVHAQVARIAHQEQRCQVAENIRKPR